MQRSRPNQRTKIETWKSRSNGTLSFDRWLRLPRIRGQCRPRIEEKRTMKRGNARKRSKKVIWQSPIWKAIHWLQIAFVVFAWYSSRLTHRFIAMIISLRTRLYSSAHFVVHIIVKLPSFYVLYLQNTSTEFPFPFGYKVKLNMAVLCAHFHS